MNTNAARSQTRRMYVAVYRVENTRSLLPLRRYGESAFGLTLRLRCLVRDEVMGDDSQAAAARVWFDTIGSGRREKLRELNAPTEILKQEEDLNWVNSQLVSSSLLPGIGYMFDNSVEAWLISVDWDWEATEGRNAKERKGGASND